MQPLTWPTSATAQSTVLGADWRLFTTVGLVVIALVWGLLFFAMMRFRRKGGDDAPVQFRNNFALEIGWTIAPLIVVTALFVYTYRAEASVDSLVAHPAVVIVVRAYRWGWNFAYDGGPTVGGASNGPVGGGAPTNRDGPPELVLPVGETTRIELTSDDVTHGFWVPDFLFKRDAIPGTVNTFDLLPDKLGTYIGRCSQFCGIDHALMLFTVKVVSPRAFAAWRLRPVPL
jgi:cytochrome c oxidase subunit 2